MDRTLDNYETIVVVIMAMQMIASAALSILLINQNKKLGNSQRAMEQRISTDQSNLLSSQNSIAVYPYKRDIYFALLEIFSICDTLLNLYKIKLYEKKFDDLAEIFKLAVQDRRGCAELFNVLSEAPFVFTQNVSDSVIDVRTHLDKLLTGIAQLDTLKKILTDEEKEIMKHDVLDTIRERCESIGKHSMFFAAIMEDVIKIK